MLYCNDDSYDCGDTDAELEAEVEAEEKVSASSSSPSPTSSTEPSKSKRKGKPARGSAVPIDEGIFEDLVSDAGPDTVEPRKVVSTADLSTATCRDAELLLNQIYGDRDE